MRSMKSISNLPLITLALCVAVASAAESFGQNATGARDGQRQTRVVARGRLTGAGELQQVVAWQTRGAAHLAIETAGSRPRVLWQMEGGNSMSRVDSVRTSDLDGDGVPEIMSLWWNGGSPGARLRVIHWNRGQNSFVELQVEDELNSVDSYRVSQTASNRSTSRLLVNVRPATGARRRPSGSREYELRGSTLVRVGGGRDVTTQGESGIEGQALISPARPGPLRQGQSGSAPHKTTLVIWRTSDDREVKRLETGSDGRFRVAVPPGEYRIGPPPQTGRFLPRGSEETVTVTPGAFARVTIHFDSGMR